VEWADLMVEQFAANQLDIPTEDTDWRDWARALNAIDVFVTQAVPSPDIYDNWVDWAFSLMNCMDNNV
jgi:hypothetical protein